MKPPIDHGYDEWILRALRRISRAIDLHSRKLAREHGLTSPQLVCLRQLAQNDCIGPGRLAKEVSLSPATVTGILDRLERQGLVTRERATWDRRQVEVRLTEEGQRVVHTAPLPLQERFKRRLARLSEPEQAEIERVLSRIVEMMEADHLDAAPLLGSGPADVDSRELEDFLTQGTPEPDPDAVAPDNIVHLGEAGGRGRHGNDEGA